MELKEKILKDIKALMDIQLECSNSENYYHTIVGYLESHQINIIYLDSSVCSGVLLGEDYESFLLLFTDKYFDEYTILEYLSTDKGNIDNHFKPFIYYNPFYDKLIAYSSTYDKIKKDMLDEATELTNLINGF